MRDCVLGVEGRYWKGCQVASVVCVCMHICIYVCVVGMLGEALCGVLAGLFFGGDARYSIFNLT